MKGTRYNTRHNSSNSAQISNYSMVKRKDKTQENIINKPLNISNISIVAEDETSTTCISPITKSSQDIIRDLRNKLADSESRVSSLEDLKTRLQDKIKYLEIETNSKDKIIRTLTETIQTSKITKTLQNVSTMTDSNQNDKDTQTIPVSVSVQCTKGMQMRDNSEKSSLTNFVNTSTSHTSHKSKILLLSDSQGRYCAPILKKMFDEDFYNPLAIFKPNADFDNIVSDVETLTKDFDKNDYVIILGGSNNALNGTSVSNNFVERLKNTSKKTNLIIYLTPFWQTNITFNKAILENNFQLISALRNEVKIINSETHLTRQNFTRHGLHLNYTGKIKLLTEAKNYIIKVRMQNQLNTEQFFQA